MADFQRVIESLRDLRQGPLQTVTDEITHLAADYAVLCTQANERLRQCSAFLQQGLRTEAIHLADQSPNLLDLVASLDLPDPQAWIDFCQNNGLTVPPLLQLDRASQLNDAYAQDQPLEHLLSRHRLLALSRAPVRKRLETMRQIAQADGGNANWEKDIRILEKARLRELSSAFHNAVRSHSDETIVALMQEVSQSWYETVPADLTTAITDAYSRVQRSSVEVELRTLVEPLRDAYAAQSLQECQALVQRWKNVMASGNVTNIAPELLDEIRPVVAFVTEQTQREERMRKFREGCKTFAQMLDRDMTDAQLEAGYAKLREFREDIPEDLTRRYMNKKTNRRRSADRSHKVRLVTIASVAVSAVVITLVVLWLQSLSSAASGWADRISKAVKLHTRAGLDEAQGYVNTLRKDNPSLLRERVVAAAVSDMENAQAEFATNQATLHALIQRVEEARKAAAPVIANPASPTASISAAGNSLQSMIDQVNAAKGLEWVDAENRLTSARAGLQNNLGTLRDRVAAAARTELDKIATALDAVPLNPTTPESVTEARARIADLNDRISALRTLPLLDADTQNQIAILGKSVIQRREAADASRTVAQELENIRQHAESAADLRAALASFIKQFPSDPHTRDFTQALQRLPLATALEAWQQFLANTPQPLAGSLQALQKRLEGVNAYLAAHPESPMGATIAQYADYLRHSIEAQSDKGTWQTAFADLLAAPMLRDLRIMTISDGRKYYVLGDIQRTERRINNQISVTFEALDPDNLAKRIRITVDGPLRTPAAPTPAPHTKVVGEIADGLKLIGESNWDSYGIDLADRLTRNEGIDPVVKAILLLQTLKTQQAVMEWSGSGLEETYTKTITEISRQTPDQLPWHEPTRISEGTRKAIQQSIEGMPTAAVMRQKLATAKAGLAKSLSFDLLGTGVLLKDDQGAWAVHTRASKLAGSMLWTVVPPTSPTPPPATSPATQTAGEPALNPGSLMMIGTVIQNRFVLDDAAAVRSLPEGTIVYISRP